MKFEVGKWYLNDNYPSYKFLCANITGGQAYDFISYVKKNGIPWVVHRFYAEIEQEPFYELKEPRVIETKTEWYAAADFSSTCDASRDIHVFSGIPLWTLRKTAAGAKSDIDRRYPSLVKVEIAAKVTEILEDEQ